MKPVIEALIQNGLSLAVAGGERVAEVRVGLGYTAVTLESGKAGVGAMLRYMLDVDGCSILPYAGTLGGRDAGELVPLLRSPGIVEPSIGLAAVNALFQPECREGLSTGDPVDLLGIRPKDRVAMVGYMAPVVERIRRAAAECIVFDDGRAGEEGITETSLEEDLLPGCDVVVLSATSLLNKTFDRLVELSAGAREICVMGASTPLAPGVFRPRSVTLLSGRRFTDPGRLLRVVGEAGGRKSLAPISLKVNILLK